MKNTFTISIGYSAKNHEALIKQYSQDIPEPIVIKSYLQERYFSADGSDFIPFVIAFHQGFTEGLYSGLGEYVFNLVMKKTKKLITEYVRGQKVASSFELSIIKGDDIMGFKAEQVSEALAEKALDAFIEIAKSSTGKKSAGDYYFNTKTTTWTNNSDKI